MDSDFSSSRVWYETFYYTNYREHNDPSQNWLGWDNEVSIGMLNYQLVLRLYSSISCSMVQKILEDHGIDYTPNHEMGFEIEANLGEFLLGIKGVENIAKAMAVLPDLWVGKGRAFF